VDVIAFGRGMRALRIRRVWTQDDLGRRAGMSRGAVARIEQGQADCLTVRSLERLAAALGARVLVRLSWNGEGLDRLIDARHAATVEHVVRILRAADWLVATEVSFNEFGERGSYDILTFNPATGALLVIEVKTVVPDVRGTLSTFDRKVRLAPGVARGLGWLPTSTSRLLVMVDTRSSRQRVALLRDTFQAVVPDRGWTVRRWIAAPEPTKPLRGLWFLSTESQAVATQRVRRSVGPPKRGPGAES
jgi:transcriptional regulator with XRE-family HTH domain